MRLALLAAALMLGACAGLSPAVNQPSGNSCEAKVVRAMTSPGKPVAGAYACFDLSDSHFADGLASAGIADDRSLASFAEQAPVYTSAALCPKQPTGYRLYELSHGADHQAMRLHLTSSGKVDAVNFAGMQSTCSSVGAA